MQSIEKKRNIKRHTKDESQQLVEYRANRIKEKQMEYIAKQIPFDLKSGCRHDGEKIVMQCVLCEKWLPRDTRNFHASHGAANFELCPPGHESLCNSAKKPCLKCFRALSVTNLAENPETFKRKKVSDVNKADVKKHGMNGTCTFDGMFKDVVPKCTITGFELNFGSYRDFRCSINNKENKKPHSDKLCELTVFEMNVAQHNAIESIPQAYAQYVRGMHIYYQACVDNKLSVLHEDVRVAWIASVKATSDNIHEYLRHRIATHIYVDTQRKRIKQGIHVSNELRNMIVENSVRKLAEQHYLCFTSFTPMTAIPNDPCHISFERLDNSRPHFDDDGGITNIVFVCRGLNVAAGMSRLKMLRILLYSPKLKPDYSRETYELAHADFALLAKNWKTDETQLLLKNLHPCKPQ